GAARAVGASLVAAGCGEMVVANRTPAHAETLAALLHARGASSLEVVSLEELRRGAPLEDAGLVVNTTPVGLAGRSLAVRIGATPRRCLVVDLVYGSAPSPFLRAAARAGRPVLDGAAMLLYQGVLAFEAWTGRRAPLEAMALPLRRARLGLRVRPCPRSVARAARTDDDLPARRPPAAARRARRRPAGAGAGGPARARRRPGHPSRPARSGRRGPARRAGRGRVSPADRRSAQRRRSRPRGPRRAPHRRPPAPARAAR